MTLSALTFTIFAYETSDLTWRELVEKFCDEKNRIAHSTLYTAAHRMGTLLQKKPLESLRREYLPAQGIRRANLTHLVEGRQWSALKALFYRTQTCERAARQLVAALLPGRVGSFFPLFVRHLDALNQVLGGALLPRLYPRGDPEGIPIKNKTPGSGVSLVR